MDKPKESTSRKTFRTDSIEVYGGFAGRGIAQKSYREDSSPAARKHQQVEIIMHDWRI